MKFTWQVGPHTGPEKRAGCKQMPARCPAVCTGCGRFAMRRKKFMPANIAGGSCTGKQSVVG